MSLPTWASSSTNWKNTIPPPALSRGKGQCGQGFCRAEMPHPCLSFQYPGRQPEAWPRPALRLLHPHHSFCPSCSHYRCRVRLLGAFQAKDLGLPISRRLGGARLQIHSCMVGNMGPRPWPGPSSSERAGRERCAWPVPTAPQQKAAVHHEPQQSAFQKSSDGSEPIFG